jgi:U3 small nucleolar RNA-associated protein 19
MFETEVTRKIRNAPALAPVPQRQPIGDSFFPSSSAKAVVIGAGDEDGDGNDQSLLKAVDLVSALWVF